MKQKSNFQFKKKTAVISGNGILPILVIDELINKKSNFIILCFDKTNEHYFKHNAKINKNQIFSASISNIPSALSILKRENVCQAICCGGIKFTGLQNLFSLCFKMFLINYKIFLYIAKIMFSSQKGDNFLLLIMEKVLNSINCKVVAVQDVLPKILCQKQDALNNKLANKYKKDIDYGSKVLDILSPYDIGQAIVIQDGRVLGIECAEGTQNLIKRCSKYFFNKKQNKKPILIKKSKIKQSKKLDVPTIGVKTIIDLVDNNFAGLAIQNKSVFLMEKEKILDMCKKHNLFLKII